MLQKMDLETGIFRILSENDGPSQNELLTRLENYAEGIRKWDLVLKVDKAALSRKLKPLRDDGIILCKMKKMADRDQYAYSYYINLYLVAFEHIIKHLAEDIDIALDASPLNTQGWKKSLSIKDDKPRDLTMGTKCGLIDALIKSEYVRQLIAIYGFESVYKIYKKGVNDYCDMEEFINLAVKLAYEGVIKDRDELGQEFICDVEFRKTVVNVINSALSKTQSDP